MKHSLLRQKVQQLEKQIFNCTKCKELSKLRRTRELNCPVLGFAFPHYVEATIASIGEAPGVYKPHKGEVLIERLEDFHKIYDDRIQKVALIGKRMMTIYQKAGINWCDIQHFNVVCCSPPGYRRPHFDEQENCLDYLRARIELMQNVKLIVTFGKAARTAIKRLKLSLPDLPVVTSYHPSYIFGYMSTDDRDKYVEQVSNNIRQALT